MESLQFVGCSWFIGLIGLGFRFTQNKSTSTELCALPRPFPVSSSTHLDAPGVPSTARERHVTGFGSSRIVCVFITAGPMIKLCTVGEGGQ